MLCLEVLYVHATWRRMILVVSVWYEVFDVHCQCYGDVLCDVE